MIESSFNIVWFKRDLRLNDHEPLFHAINSAKPTLLLYLFEPEFIDYPDTSPRHLKFCYDSIYEMNQRLKENKIQILEGKAETIFEFILTNYKVHNIFSYQESGTNATFSRDKNIRKICKKNDVKWYEYTKEAVYRGIKNRKDWDKNWFSFMHQPQHLIDVNRLKKINLNLDRFFLSPKTLNIFNNSEVSFQPAGETYAWKYLHSFLDKRAHNYNRYISKPFSSRTSCGRISPYLAWGNLSSKQVYQFVIGHDNFKLNKRSLTSFLARVKWRSHFIQKFEMQPDYEYNCLNPGFETMEKSNNEEYLNTWKTGQTGIPLADANMRYLIATGWINFRMRAMLVSFLCHNLDIDFRKGMYHLAQMFLDYEPGIHFTQFQM